MDNPELRTQVLYSSPVYPEGFSIGTAEREATEFRAVQFSQCENMIAVPQGTPEEAVMAVCFSVAVEQLERTHPLPGDRLLVLAESVEGLVTLAAAKRWGLTSFYCDPDPGRRVEAEKLGAVTFSNQSEWIGKIRDLTEGEGPNLIVELTGEEGLLSLLVNTVLSQAGRIVLGRKTTRQDSYQMRMGSYKEVDIIGWDRCTSCAAISEEERTLLTELLQYVSVEQEQPDGIVRMNGGRT